MKTLLLVVIVGLAVSPVCEPFCADASCDSLNGDVVSECGACTEGACHPGAPGFPEEQLQARLADFPPPQASENYPSPSAPPPETAYDEEIIGELDAENTPSCVDTAPRKPQSFIPPRFIGALLELDTCARMLDAGLCWHESVRIDCAASCGACGREHDAGAPPAPLTTSNSSARAKVAPAGAAGTLAAVTSRGVAAELRLVLCSQLSGGGEARGSDGVDACAELAHRVSEAEGIGPSLDCTAGGRVLLRTLSDWGQSHRARSLRWMAIKAYAWFVHQGSKELSAALLHAMRDDGALTGAAREGDPFLLDLAATEAMESLLGENVRSDTLVSHVGELLEHHERHAPQEGRVREEEAGGGPAARLHLIVAEATGRLAAARRRAGFPPPPTAVMIENYLRHDSARLQMAALLALEAMRSTSSADEIDALANRPDVDSRVRCAAARVLASLAAADGEPVIKLSTQLSASGSVDSDGGCEVVWQDLARAFRDSPTPDAASDAAEAAIDAALWTPPSNVGATLLVLILNSAPRYDTRWRALLTLRLVHLAPVRRSSSGSESGGYRGGEWRVGAAGAARTTGVLLMDGKDLRERRLGLHILALLAPPGDDEVRGALVTALGDSSGIQRIEAGEHLARMADVSVIGCEAIELLQGLDGGAHGEASPTEHRLATLAAIRRIATRCCDPPRAAEAAGALAGLEREPGDDAWSVHLEQAEDVLRACGGDGRGADVVASATAGGDASAAADDPPTWSFVDGTSPLLNLPPVVDEAPQPSTDTASADANPAASVPFVTSKGKVGIMDHLRGRHCVAALRSMPQQVLLATYRAFLAPGGPKSCDLESEVGGAARGALLARGALGEEEAELMYAYWARQFIGNASGTVRDPGRFVGRTIWRGGGAPLDDKVVDALHRVLERWHALGVAPAVWPRSHAAAADAALGGSAAISGAPTLQDSSEYIELDARKQHATCPDREWTRCATDWHVDGGLRGYKLWTVVRRDARLRPDLNWRFTGIDPAARAAREHGNIVISTSSNLRALCELAFEVNRSMTAASVGTADGGNDELQGLDRVTERKVESSSSQKGQCIYERHNEHMASMRKDSEVFSQERDELALEAAGCVVTADVGDVLLIGPDVFHRTQDMAASRLALLVEAM